jgi:hypothetical protein
MKIFPKEVNKGFVSQPLDQEGSDSNPLNLQDLQDILDCQMVHLSKQPLP